MVSRIQLPLKATGIWWSSGQALKDRHLVRVYDPISADIPGKDKIGRRKWNVNTLQNSYHKNQNFSRNFLRLKCWLLLQGKYSLRSTNISNLGQVRKGVPWWSSNMFPSLWNRTINLIYFYINPTWNLSCNTLSIWSGGSVSFCTIFHKK